MVPLSVGGPNADPGVPDEILARADVGDSIPARNLATWAAFASGSPRAPYLGIALVGGLAAVLLAAAYRLVPASPGAPQRPAPVAP
jgi:hypothetical protein